MFRYSGGQMVRHGFYWNARTWAITLVGREGGTLPGDAGDRYARVPAAVMLLIAPVMGAAYVIFLPLIGFAMVLDVAARRAWRAARRGIWTLAATVAPRWRPGEAYLAERRGTREPSGSSRSDHDEAPGTGA